MIARREVGVLRYWRARYRLHRIRRRFGLLWAIYVPPNADGPETAILIPPAAEPIPLETDLLHRARQIQEGYERAIRTVYQEAQRRRQLHE